MQMPFTVSAIDADELIEEYQELIFDFSNLLKNIAIKLTEKEHPTSQERHNLLILSAAKVFRSARASLPLSNHRYAEEIATINRGAAEVCINAAYLQEASATELDLFFRQDMSKMARWAKRANAHMLMADRYSSEDQSTLHQLLSAPEISVWTVKSVMQRAKDVDDRLKAKLFMKGLALFVYETAHVHVHGTAYSIQNVGNWALFDGDEDSKDRIATTVLALHGTVLSLTTFCKYIISRYPVGFTAELASLHGRLLELSRK